MISIIIDNLTKHFFWFVLITTIILYIILRWKRSEKKKSQCNEPTSNLIYLILWPALLYAIYYLFLRKSPPPIQNTLNTLNTQNIQNTRAPAKGINKSSTSLMSSPYPNSNSISV